MQMSDLREAQVFAQTFIPILSGIYRIMNKETGKAYVGSAINIKNRWRKHKKDLRSGKHPNRFLSNAWSKYGADNFDWLILEYVADTTKLLEREQFWIDTLTPYERDFGYNIRRVANSNLGMVFSQETRDKISAANMGKHGQKRPPITDEQRAKISAAHIGKPKPHFRNLEKWPHADGIKCKCLECKSKRNEKELARLELDRRDRGIQPVRKIDKWPHGGGSQCPCDECRAKRSANSLAGYHRRRLEKLKKN